jgi:hypothetical protein
MVRSQGGRVDQFPLLQGEETCTAQDAGHWISVYEQLISFCRSVLAEDDVDHGIDRAALYARKRHFEARREYWLKVLDGDAVGAESGLNQA